MFEIDRDVSSCSALRMTPEATNIFKRILKNILFYYPFNVVGGQTARSNFFFQI